MSHNHHCDGCDQHQSGEEEKFVSLTAEHSGDETDDEDVDKIANGCCDQV